MGTKKFGYRVWIDGEAGEKFATKPEALRAIKSARKAGAARATIQYTGN